MKTLRFLATADWHSDSDLKKQQKLEASLKQIVEYCKTVKVDAIIHAGDVWEKSQKYQENSGVPLVQNYLRELSKLVDFIFITKGNNSHDEPGSISLLHQLEPNIYAYEYPVVLSVCEDSSMQIVDIIREIEFREPDFIVSLVPYPTKASLLIEDSIDNNNAEFIQKFEQIFEHIGDVTQPYTCPKLLGFHGNVVGSRLSSGQTLVSQDIMVAASTLEKAKHDYFALGHIHLRQEIKPWMKYSGSIYNKGWGETEQKSFEVIEYLGTEFTTDQIMLTSARPMITVEADFVNRDFKITNWDMEEFPFGLNPEVRFRCKVLENERNLITENNIAEVKREFGDDVKIEFNIIPVERDARSEAIMTAKDLLQEVIEYAKVTEAKIDNGVLKKVVDLQEVAL